MDPNVTGYRNVARANVATDLRMPLNPQLGVQTVLTPRMMESSHYGYTQPSPRTQAHLNLGLMSGVGVTHYQHQPMHQQQPQMLQSHQQPQQQMQYQPVMQQMPVMQQQIIPQQPQQQQQYMQQPAMQQTTVPLPSMQTMQPMQPMLLDLQQQQQQKQPSTLQFDMPPSTSTQQHPDDLNLLQGFGTLPDQFDTLNEGSSVGTSDTAQGQGLGSRKKEIYGYTAPHTLYSTGWSYATDPQRKFRIAVSTFVEEYSNKVMIVQLDEEAGELVHRSSFDHPYPATKIMWIPDLGRNYPDLLATSGDYLRVWRVGRNNGANIQTLLNTNRLSEYCSPLSSFDWSEIDVSLIGTSSIDTTCTVWQIETGQAIGSTKLLEANVRTHLIAHDKEVFDIGFSKKDSKIFASVGSDGSMRLFDLRALEHSTIIYEEPNKTPLLKLAWNRVDHNRISTFAQDSNEVIILDLRFPCKPLHRLKNQSSSMNGMSWAPHVSGYISTCCDDGNALIWDVQDASKPVEDPILAYKVKAEVNQIHWSTAFPDWVSICYKNRLEILRV